MQDARYKQDQEVGICSSSELAPGFAIALQIKWKEPIVGV